MLRGGRRAAWVWARHDTRRRWPALIALGVLIGVTAGLAMAAIAGARRTDTALARLRVRTNAADAIVFTSQVGAYHPDWSRLVGRPEIKALARWDLVFGAIGGQPGVVLFASTDGRWLRDINRPVVVKGRMFDPAASDEVVASEDAAAQDGLHVGSTAPFQGYGLTQHNNDTPAGPKVSLRVVGIVRGINQFLFSPQVFVSPGLVARYRDQMLLHENAEVQLTRGAADVPALQRDVNALVVQGAPVLNLHAVTRRVDTTMAVERTALLLLAAAVGIAGGLLVAQALGRSASLVADDAIVLRAVGMTRAEIASAAGMSHLLTFGVGAATAVLTAVVASRWFPVGEARRIDPGVGMHADWTVLGPGIVLTILLVVSGTLLVAARSSVEASRDGLLRTSFLVAWIRRLAPVTVGLGASMALEGGRGRSRAAVRPALIGAVVGVLGVVGTVTIDHGLRDALAHPERAGVTWDATVTPNDGDYTPDGVRPQLIAAVKAEAAGSAVSVIDRRVVDVGGIGVPAFTVRPAPGEVAAPLAFTLISGRAPNVPGEAAIGPATAHELKVNTGSTVAVGSDHAKVRVVGQALFPSNVHAEFDQGLWLPPAQFDLAAGSVEPSGTNPGSRIVAVRFASGTNKGTALNRLTDKLGAGASGVKPVEIPVELGNLHNVQTLPRLLAVFLALLAVAALSHVLVTSSRLRAHDFAILRALGLNRPATRLVLHWQGAVIGLVGLVAGIPLGVAVGRTAWRLLAERVPLAQVRPFALLGILVLVPATVLVVNAVAVWPGRRVALLPTVEVLRTE